MESSATFRAQAEAYYVKREPQIPSRFVINKIKILMNHEKKQRLFENRFSILFVLCHLLSPKDFLRRWEDAEESIKEGGDEADEGGGDTAEE
jgi:hypothetical protein